MHKNRHCKKKLGSYLHSYGLPNDVEILTFPLIRAKKYFFQKYACNMSNEASWKGEFRFFKNFEKNFKLAELGPKMC